MRRVYIVTDVDLTEKSAQPVHIFSLAKYLCRSGLEMRLIYPCWQGRPPKMPFGVIGVPIRVSPRPFVRARMFQAKLFLELARLPRPDVVYVRLSGGMVAPVVWTTITGIPLFIEVNGILDMEYLMLAGQNTVVNIRRWFKVWRMRMVEALNLKRATGIIFVTAQLKEYYSQRYRIPQDKAVVINNGVDLEIFRPIDKQQSRLQLGIPEGPPLLGFVGLLAPWQGVDDAILALKILEERGVACRLLIVGEGPEKAQLEALVQELGLSAKVAFTGGVRWEDVPLYISACDLCLIPKRTLVSGVSPLKLYEYMACAKPIVATDVPGLDLVTKIGAGVNVKARCPEDLARGIEELIQRKQEWDKMGLRGRYHVENHASWQHVAGKTLAFLENRIRGI